MLRAAAWKALAIALGLTALVAALWLYLGIAAKEHTVEGRDVGYLSGEAYARSCPSTKCESLSQLHPNQQVLVRRSGVDGEVALDSDQWVEIEYGQETAYIHSHFVSPTPTYQGLGLELLLSGALGLAFLLILALSVWQRGQLFAARNESGANYIITAVTFAAGVLSGAIGYMFARTARQTYSEFLAGAFANVGAGLVGAAVKSSTAVPL